MASPESGKDAPKEPAKPAPAPLARKGRSGDDDDEKGGARDSSQQQKFLPTGLSRAIVLATVMASIALVVSVLFANRYDLVPAPNSENSYMYRIDRLTGAVKFCGPQGCTDVNTEGAK